jgi:hypothetical protein
VRRPGKIRGDDQNQSIQDHLSEPSTIADDAPLINDTTLKIVPVIDTAKLVAFLKQVQPPLGHESHEAWDELRLYEYTVLKDPVILKVI